MRPGVATVDPVFWWTSERDGLRRAFTDGLGGASRGGYALAAGEDDRAAAAGGLNLGGHVGDDPQAVHANRAALAAELGVPAQRLVFANQVHGRDVAVVDGPWSGPVPDVDALVTTQTGLALGVLVADCTPVLLADPEAGVIGAAHAGRPGMMAGVVEAVVTAMRDLGARRLEATVGPSVCGRCYEVPAELRDQAAAVTPESAARTWVGTPAIDVATGVVAQLDALGVAVDWVPGCSVEQAGRLYSYRRDGQTGRFAGVIVREAQA